MTDKYFVHEKAVCESQEIGEGTRVWGFAQVLKGAQIGNNCNICAHSFIESAVKIGNNCTIKNGVAIWDGVTLEDGVFVGPNAVFTNDLRPRAFVRRSASTYLPTVLKSGCTIGANATIVCGITIGEYSMVGAGAVVTRDVSAHDLVVGNPARLVGRVCYCGGRLDDSDYCSVCKLALADNSAELVTKLLTNA